MFEKIIRKLMEYPYSHLAGGFILGGLLRIFLPFYLVLLLVAAFATVREIGQTYKWWPHEDQSPAVMIHDIGHFITGAAMIVMIVGIAERIF